MESGFISDLLKTYGDIEAGLRKQVEQASKDVIREWNYASAMRNLLGSGPWETGLSRRLAQITSAGLQNISNVLEDVLRTGRQATLYEALMSPAIASTLYNVYGFPGYLQTMQTAYQLASIPQQVEASNIEAALNDLFYRLGLLARISGGFGQPYQTTTTRTTTLTTPLQAILTGLSGIGYGLTRGLSSK